VQERVSQVAPFLLLDQAPYAVLSEGKQHWIQDAYTTCDRYPYSNVQTGGKGSGVIRGKLNVIPIENSFLYVVPLYLKAEGTNFPQLKWVIVATGDKIVMEPTLDEALGSLFGTTAGQPGSSPGSQAGPQAALSASTRDQATAQLAEAQKALNALKQLLAKPAQ